MAIALGFSAAVVPPVGVAGRGTSCCIAFPQLRKYVYQPLHTRFKVRAGFSSRPVSSEDDEELEFDDEELGSGDEDDTDYSDEYSENFSDQDEEDSEEQDEDSEEEQDEEAKPFSLPLVTGERGPFPGASRTGRKRGGLWNEPAHRLLILKPPMSDSKVAQRLLSSPQFKLKTLPLLSSCLPGAALREEEKEWFLDNILEVKDALGYAVFGADDDVPEDDCWQHENPDPAAHLGTLLYLAFQHEECSIAKKSRHTRVSHLRLAFLGEFVLELALCELLLQVYPRETPASLRERAFAVTNKRGLGNILRDASLYDLAFPDRHLMYCLPKARRLILHKGVFLGIISAVYLSLGMSEVYRLLFETFGFDLNAIEAQPKKRSAREDVDHVSADFKVPLTWQDVAFYKPPADVIFAAPRLFRACVPPGMYRFHKSAWETQALPRVVDVLGYPLIVQGDTREVAEARNRELGLGAQLCFMHPSLYKAEHPRFCNERLEYLGSKIQDLVIAERLLMKNLDAPDRFLQREHRRLMMNRICGRRLRMKRLHRLIMYHEERQVKYDKVRRLRNYTTNAVEQAIHGLGYVVYGKAEVRRLLLDVFEVEKPLPTQADFNDRLAQQRRKFLDTVRPVY